MAQEHRVRPRGENDAELRDGDLLHAVLESAAQGILTVGADGMVQAANRAAHQLFGYPPGALLGASVESLVPDAVADHHAAHRAQFFTDPHVRPMGLGLELLGKRLDGSTFPVEISLSHVQAGDKVLAIAFVSDITARKSLQSQLIESQRLEAVGQLAGGIAHDFNNLLTIILGHNTLLLEKLSPLDPLRGSAEEICRAGERAGALVKQILAFSSRQFTHFARVELNGVVSEIHSMLEPVIGENIELTLELSDDLHPVTADAAQLEQVILNLAVNARDAMPDGGKLTIETTNVRLDEHYARGHLGVAPGDYVQLTVADTGIGMDAETRSRLFDPFYTTKGAMDGTGLGLSTVYGIVKRHHGDIWLYSEPGGGTTFKVYLPVATSQSRAVPEAPSEPRPKVHPATVLLVEDEDALRSLMIRVLVDAGHEVLDAADADEAVRLSRNYDGEINLLLSDVMLSRGTGPKLAEAILAHRLGIKVLFISGYSRGAVDGIDGLPYHPQFLAKPFNGRDLIESVERALSGRVEAG